MGRTVRALALFAAAIAVFAITGNVQISLALVMAGIGTLAMPKPPKPTTTESPVKSPIPRRISAYGRSRLYGAYILYEQGASNQAYDVFAVHEGRLDAIETRYLADDRVTKNFLGEIVSSSPSNDGRYVSANCFWFETTGTDPGPGLPGIASRLPSKWTAAHRGDGVVLIGIYWHAPKQETFGKRFPQGGPVPASIVARWQRVFDWRDPSQDVSDPDTWQWSENACLHLAHYRLVREKARRDPNEAMPSPANLADAWALYFAPTVAYWTEAANVCDEAVALKAGGTEPRYRSCFSHYHTDPHKEVINALTACFDGWTSPRSDGALVVYAGKYYAPTVDIGPAEIVSYGWTYGTDDESAVNEITLTYVSSDHDFSTVDTTPWQDVDDIASRGAVRSTSLENPVPTHGQARRLAKRLMARVMAPSRGTVTTNVAGRIARGQRYINLLIEEAGAVFFDGPAEIVEMTRNMATGGVTFSWVAADPNIDAWNPATEEGDPAPVSTRVAVASLSAPTVTTTAIVYAGATADGTGARVQIDAAAPVDAGEADSLTWFARWRVQGASIWNEQRYNDTDPTAAVELLTSFVPVGVDLEVEVAYQTGDGRLSPYSSPPTVVTTDTETVAPDAATAVVLVQWLASLDLSTPAIPRASSYVWKFYASDGTTLKRTLTTASRYVSYERELAGADGQLRDYIVTVAGVNAAGTGAVATSALLSNPAPAAVTGFSVADDAHTAAAVFTASSDPTTVGYLFAFSRTSGFDATTSGFLAQGTVSPIFYYGASADTYYGKVAPYDAWSAAPAMLNFTAEDTFAITVGGGASTGGASSGGGGTGGSGGGFIGRVSDI